MTPCSGEEQFEFHIPPLVGFVSWYHDFVVVASLALEMADNSTSIHVQTPRQPVLLDWLEAGITDTPKKPSMSRDSSPGVDVAVKSYRRIDSLSCKMIRTVALELLMSRLLGVISGVGN